MRYDDFRDAIRSELRRTRAGLTWAQLRERLRLPYDRPCPAWTARLEKEIGLARARPSNGGRSFLWKLSLSRA
jgi:hypothetical protein